MGRAEDGGSGAGASPRGGEAIPHGGPRFTDLDRHARIALGVLLVAFALQGVFGRSLWGGNDSREGGMIWDMYRHGTWVTPTINGEPFLEKPPLLHWTGLLIAHAAGRVTEGLVRLPAALYGLGTLVLVYLFTAGPRAPGEPRGADAGRRLAAWAAVFTLGTAIEFHEYSRIVLTDVALTFVVALALFVFWHAWQRPSPARWMAFLAAAAAAFYGKGLIGPALIWASVAVFLLWQRRFRLLAGLGAAYVPVLLAAVLPWVLALDRSWGAAAVRFAFWDNQVGRFFRFGNAALPHDPFFINKEPVYYYLAHLPLYLLPWTLLLVPALVAWWRRSSPFRAPFHLFVNSAVAGMLLVLHLSSSKVVNYALPVFPFLFVMLGVWIADVARRPLPSLLERVAGGATAWGLAALFALVPVTFVVGTFVRPGLFRTGGRVTTIASVLLALLLLALVATAGTVILRLARSAARPLALPLAPAAVALVAMGAIQLVTPAIERHRSYRPFVTLAAGEAMRGRSVALAASQQCDVGAFTFYLDHRLAVLRDAAAVAAYLKGGEPRAVIVPVRQLAAIDAEIGAVPHAGLRAGAPGTVSRSFVLLINQPREEAAALPAGVEGEEVLGPTAAARTGEPPAGAGPHAEARIDKPAGGGPTTGGQR